MKNVKTITRLAIVAALYVVLTVVILPYSYNFIQFRISEILVLLAFYRKDYSYSLILGCFIANILSPLTVIDMIFGTLATAIAVYLVANSKHLWIASLYPVIINGIIVGAIWYFFGADEVTIWAAFGYVALGEFVVVSLIGVSLFKLLEKNDQFMILIEANQNVK